MTILQEFEQEQLTKLTENKEIPDFRSGDTVRIMVKVIEGARERVQAFEGLCIARKNAGINSSFTVRKISYGEGVERVFPLYSPNIEIKVMRRGIVRRAKLYYLRGLTGKKARIAEKIVRKTGAKIRKTGAKMTIEEAKPVEPAEPVVEAEAKETETKVPEKNVAKPRAEKSEKKDAKPEAEKSEPADKADKE